MKTIFVIVSLIVALFSAVPSNAQSPGCPTCIGLDSWYFPDTYWLTDANFPPVAFTNLVNLDGNYGNQLLLDTTNTTPAFLLYNLIDTNVGSGTVTNLLLSHGTISLWFKPNWSTTNHGGTGPGDYANLISVGQAGTNGTPWWAWYMSPDGATMYFGSQTNGQLPSIWLTAPVTFTNTNWYNLVITYNSTNTAFYANGVFVTNGLPVTNWPGPTTTTFAIGSDTNGLFQGRGTYSFLQTFNYTVDSNTIAGTYGLDSMFFGLAYQVPSYHAVMPGPTAPFVAPLFDPFSGPGFLVPGTSTSQPTNAKIWLTNYSATVVATNVINLKFAVAGGTDGYPYDVFATPALQIPLTNATWYWMGQAWRGTNYTLPITNTPIGSVFLILGVHSDNDHDGLTDAFELLSSKTDWNLTNANTYSGIPDAWIGINALSGSSGFPSQDPDADGLSNTQEYLWGSNPTVSEGITPWVANPSGYSGIP